MFSAEDSFTEDSEMVIILELAAHGDLSSLLSGSVAEVGPSRGQARRQ